MAKPVVIPDSELQASVGDILDGEVVPADGLLPSWTGGSPADGCLLLPPARLTREQVAENITMSIHHARANTTPIGNRTDAITL